MSADCLHLTEVNAYVAGELAPHDREVFETHLAGCAECRAEAESTRRLIGRLHAVPELESRRDLAPLILARLREEPRELPRPARWPRMAAIAAVLTLCAGGVRVAYFTKPTPPSGPALAVVDENPASFVRALDWFCQNQEPDGSWNAEKWGGNRRFEVSLTALPALALLGAESPTPDHSSAVGRAIQWLQNQQGEAGTFGPDFQGACYNQSIATLALLRAYERHPDAALKGTLDAAVATILARPGQRILAPAARRHLRDAAAPSGFQRNRFRELARR